MRLTFPSPRELVAGPEVVAWTSTAALTVENLRASYRTGVFPWPGPPGMKLPWCFPARRAILVFAELTPGRTLEKTVRRRRFTFSLDQAFPEVIAACSVAPREGQTMSWITPPMIAAYTELHRAGVAHSVEVWSADGALVGGLYGVDAGGVFCGESMFHRADNASKLAILHLAAHLVARGSPWMDIQQLTPHMARLGAREVSRKTYLARLSEEVAASRPLFDFPQQPPR